MPDLDKPKRQDVETEAAEELRLREGHGSELTAMGIIFIAKSNRAGLVIQRLQSAVGDGDAMCIATYVGQHRLRTGKRPFGVDHPFVTTDATQPAREEARTSEVRFQLGELQLPSSKQLLEPVAEFGTEDQRQRPD